MDGKEASEMFPCAHTIVCEHKSQLRCHPVFLLDIVHVAHQRWHGIIEHERRMGPHHLETMAKLEASFLDIKFLA